MIALLRGLAVVTITATGALAQAAAPVTLKPVALSDTRTVVYWAALVHPDCTLAGSYAVKVRKEPKNGTVEVVDEGGFTNFPASNPRSKCNTRQVPLTKIFYTSKPDFSGSDVIDLELFDPIQAKSTKISVTVTVKK